jgi:DNA-binding HxlR family transcriptional regulator
MFATQFTDDMILSHITHQARTPAAIANSVGCSAMTIIRALPRFEEEGFVERVVIESINGREVTGWFREHK